MLIADIAPKKRKTAAKFAKTTRHAVPFSPSLCPVFRSYLTKLRDDEFGGRRQLRVPATDDARLAPKAQRLVINGDHSVRFPVRKDLRGRKAEAVGHPECREDQRK